VHGSRPEPQGDKVKSFAEASKGKRRENL
jgi:hypothetical protein